MSGASKIEWTDATWNPVTGCTKVSQGCKHCYAERDWARLSAPREKTNAYTGRAFTDVQCHPERLDWPLRRRKASLMFVNSMSDLFHDDVPDDFILQVFDIFRECQNGWSKKIGGDRGQLLAAHTFQILTKRPSRMLDFCTRLRFAQNDGRGLYLAKTLPHNGFNPMPALKNVWLGVSVEDQATADERIPLLLQTPAAVRWISAEPLLGPVRIDDLSDGRGGVLKPLCGLHWEPCPGGLTVKKPRSESIHWVVAGGESGPKARPSHPNWFRSLRDQCKAAGVPFLFKQWGEWAPETVACSGRTAKTALYISDDGATRPAAYGARNGSVTIQRMGKRATGRLLDDVLHNEYPVPPLNTTKEQQ